MIDNKSKQEVIRQAMLTEFWQIICEALDDSIEQLRKDQTSQDLKDLPAAEYKLTNELLLFRIKYLQDLKELPDQLILFLNDVPNDSKVFDPYRTSKDFTN